jgi:hypothetical protein
LIREITSRLRNGRVPSNAGWRAIIAHPDDVSNRVFRVVQIGGCETKSMTTDDVPWDRLWGALAVALEVHVRAGRRHLLTEDVVRFATVTVLAEQESQRTGSLQSGQSQVSAEWTSS